MKQSLAIAYAIKRKNSKMAHGGMAGSEPSIKNEANAAAIMHQILAKKMACGGMAEGGDVEELYEGEPEEMDPMALSEEGEDSDAGKMAHGGMVKSMLMKHMMGKMRK